MTDNSFLTDESMYKSHSPEHNLWYGMMCRCFSQRMQAHSPTYVGCTASENFQDFQWFARWCNRQIGFEIPGRQLDKDILIKGNKHYGEGTCVFVPREINNLFIKRGNDRGALPIGVFSYRSGRFGAQVSRDNGPRFIGYFDTPEDAFCAYKRAKEDYIKHKANIWKDFLDPRTYDALMNYEVNIND